MPGALKVWDGSAWLTASASGSNTSVFVGPSAPGGTPRSGDLWYDTDEPSPFGSVIGVTNGGTGASNTATARSNLSVPQIGQSGSVAGAPTTGTWARGDTWLDSNDVLWVCRVAGAPGTWKSLNQGEELAYNQITANITITAPSTAQALLIAGTTRSYDGGGILVTLNVPTMIVPSGGWPVFNLFDGATDLGYIGSTSTVGNSPGYYSRRIAPSAGSHTYSIYGWNNGTGSPAIGAGVGTSGNYAPSYIRVTRA